MSNKAYVVHFHLNMKPVKVKLMNKYNKTGARFGSTYTKIGTIQRRLAWPLRKDDTQIRETFHIFRNKSKNKQMGT